MKKILLAALLITGCASPADNTLIVDRGGPLLTHPTLHMTFWGDYWSTHQIEVQAIGQKWNTLMQGSILDRLSEYGVGQGSLDLNYAAPGEVQWQAMPAEDERAELQTEIANGSLPAPTKDDLYVILLPPGITTQYAIERGFNGYHSHFMYRGAVAAYAVISYDNQNVTLSHELYEAATDPLLNAWMTGHGDEVGDLCEGIPEVIDGITVQKVWSRGWSSCL